jgi:hypothetical protein
MLYDADRGRLRGTLEHLGVLGQLVAGHPVDAELGGHLQDLRAAGAVIGDRVAPELQELVAIVSHPQLFVELETSSPAGPVRSSVAVVGRDAWVTEGWGGTDEVTWWPCQSSLLVPVVALLAGLRGRAAASVQRSEVRVPLGFAETALEALRQGGAQHRDAAVAAIVEGARSGLSAETAEAFVNVVAAYRGAWRATLVENRDGVPASRGMAVVDAGALGLYLRTGPQEPLRPEDVTADTELVLTPVAPSEVWAAIVALLDAGAGEAAA